MFTDFGLWPLVYIVLSLANFYFVYDLYVIAKNSGKKFSVIEKKLENVRNKAEKDHLTGAYNRRTFDEYYDLVYKNTLESNDAKFFILFFDIDHFKKFNDTYGHEAGDKVLIKFADTIQKNIRKDGDSFFRYGGEEFVLISTDNPRNPVYEAKFLEMIKCSR